MHRDTKHQLNLSKVHYKSNQDRPKHKVDKRGAYERIRALILLIVANSVVPEPAIQTSASLGKFKKHECLGHVLVMVRAESPTLELVNAPDWPACPD